MKKSQVLAALALAFALGLGVVAPVANTYAQITPNDATQEQKDAIYEQAREALNAAEALKNINSYISLYNSISAEDAGLIDLFADANKNIVKAYNKDYTDGSNGQMQSNSGINGDINSVSAYLNANKLYKQTGNTYDYIKADKEFAALKTVNKVAQVNTVQQAYDAIIAIRNTASDNMSTLGNNYKSGAKDEDGNGSQTPNIVDEAYAFYNAIYTKANAWLTYLNSQYGTVIGKINGNPDVLANYIKDIDEDAFDNLVDSTEWLDAKAGKGDFSGYTNIALAYEYNLVENAAKALLKYNYVNAVAEAMEDVKAVLSTTTNVSYANAQAYVAALNNAVEAFKNGTTTTTTPSTSLETITIKSSDETVTVKGKLPAGTEVKVVRSDDKVAAFGDKAYKMWDIKLVDSKGNTINSFEGSITVSIKVPEGIDGEKAGVYFVDADGNVQKYTSTYANGVLTYTTTHLSLWAVVEDNGETITTPEAPKTGIVSEAEGGASTTVAMVAGLATALTAAGAGVVAYRNARRSMRK